MNRPWMTALEMQFAALAETQRTLVRLNKGQPRAGDFRTPVLRLLSALKHAEAYAWSADPAKAVSFAAQTIPVTSSYAIPFAHGPEWWWFDQAQPHGVRALLFHYTEEALWAHVFGTLEPSVEKPFGPVPVFMGDWLWKVGKSLRDVVIETKATDHMIAGVDANGVISEIVDADDQSAITRDVFAFYLAARAWFQQRIVTWSSGHIERHRRKQLAREHQGPVPSDVKVIQLRRTENESKPNDWKSDSVDWSCRWIVNGHWRNQPYANGEHKLLYIMPFVKGPADKPLRVPTHQVYAVNR